MQRLEPRHALAAGLAGPVEPAIIAAPAAPAAPATVVAVVGVAATAGIPFTYETNTRVGVPGVTITGYAGANAGETITIPATIEGKPVIGIGDGAFSDVPSGRIRIPDSVWRTEIGADAFGNAALAAIDVVPVSTPRPGGLFSVDGVLFGRNPASFGRSESVTLLRVPAGRPGGTYVVPAGVDDFAEGAFQGCRFESLSLGPDVRFLGDSVLGTTIQTGSCPNLTSYAVDPANTVFASRDGNLYTRDGRTLLAVAPARRRVVIPFGVTTIGTDERQEHAPRADPFAMCRDHERFLSGTYEAFRAEFPASLQQITFLSSRPQAATFVFAGDAPLVDDDSEFDSAVGDALVICRGDAAGWPAEGATFHGHELVRSSFSWNWVFAVSAAPTNVRVERGAGRVRLAWDEPPLGPDEGRIEDYAVRYSNDGGATWIDVVRPASIDTTAVVQDLDVGVPYVFEVAAVNQIGRGPFAASAGEVVLGADPPATGAFRPPTGVVAQAAGSGRVAVAWRAVPSPGVRGYEIRWSSDGGWTWSQPTRTTGAATSVAIDGLADGVAQLFQVAAYGQDGAGAASRPSPVAVAVPGVGAERTGNRGRSDLRYAPDGRLARLTWQAGLGLVYRIEGRQRDMQEEVVLGREAVPTTAVPDADLAAQLLFAPDGTPQVVVAIGSGVLHYRRDAGGWRLAGKVLDTHGNRITQLSAAIDGAGAIHVLTTDRDGASSTGYFAHGDLVYATNRGGAWRQEVVATGVGAAIFYETGVYIRYMDLAVDGRGVAHVVFTPRFDVFNHRSPDGRSWTRDYSTLAYLTNASGAWVRTIVHRPADGTGASGFGASIAIGPGGQPAIAHFFMDNVATGSAVSAKLLYSVRRGDGTWATSVVATRPDRYALGDGPNFTGFAPQLAFDRQGVPHIAFSDYAAEHPPRSVIGQVHRAGQLRHAWLNPAGWATETILRSAPRAALAYPSLAVGDGQMVFSGVTLDTNRNIGLFTSIVDRPPAAPGGLTVQRGAGSAVLSWRPSGVEAGGLPVAAYVVQSSVNGGRTWVEAARVAAPTATVTGLVNGRAYFFRVAAVSNVGVGEFSAKSAAVVPATVPGTVRMLTATRRAGAADVKWAAPAVNGGSAVMDYLIQWSDDGGRNWTTVVRKASGATSTRIVAPTIGPGTRLRVAAVNGVGSGGFTVI